MNSPVSSLQTTAVFVRFVAGGGCFIVGLPGLSAMLVAYSLNVLSQTIFSLVGVKVYS